MSNTTNTTATPNTLAQTLGKLDVEQGRLGDNPTFFVSEKGTLVVKFSIANRSGRYVKDPKTGLPVERITWTDVVMFGHAGQFVLETKGKGDFVKLYGKWQDRDTKDCNGQPKTVTEFVAKYAEGRDGEAKPTQKAAPAQQPVDDELAALGDVIRS